MILKCSRKATSLNVFKIHSSLTRVVLEFIITILLVLFILVKKKKYNTVNVVNFRTPTFLSECYMQKVQTMIRLIATDKRGYPHNIFSYFSMKTYVVGTH